MTELVAKPIVKNQFWIVTDGEKKVGNIEANNAGYGVQVNGTFLQFNNKEEIKKKTHIEGDLSGILKRNTSIVATPFTRPGNRIAGIKDWNERLKIIVEKAPKWNIGAMVGIPSWCILLLEEIVKHYQLNSIQDIWPNFQVYVHGGVFMEPYIARLEKISSKKLFLLDTYLASEGYFAYQGSTRRKGMRLLLNTGIFYEFVPFNSDFFDENGVLINKQTAYSEWLFP